MFKVCVGPSRLGELFSLFKSGRAYSKLRRLQSYLATLAFSWPFPELLRCFLSRRMLPRPHSVGDSSIPTQVLVDANRFFPASGACSRDRLLSLNSFQLEHQSDTGFGRETNRTLLIGRAYFWGQAAISFLLVSFLDPWRLHVSVFVFYLFCLFS